MKEERVFTQKHVYLLTRIFLGLYLLYNIGRLWPYSVEIYGNGGMMADPRWNWNYGFFPNVLNVFDDPLHLDIFFGLMMVFSLFFLVGFFPRFTSLLLWYGWTGLFNRNFLTENPHVCYIGLMLIMFVFIREGGPLDLVRKGSWLLGGISYCFSGFSKLMSPSWQDGSAISLILKIPFVHHSSLVKGFLDLPSPVLAVVTWWVLALELAGIIAIFVPRFRFFWWASMVLMHLGLLSLWNLSSITVGMLIFHLFLFDPQWIKQGKETYEEFSFFLGKGWTWVGVSTGLFPLTVGALHLFLSLKEFSQGQPAPQVFQAGLLAFCSLMATGLSLSSLAFYCKDRRPPLAWSLVLFLALWVGGHDLIAQLATRSLPLPLVPIMLGLIYLFHLGKIPSMVGEGKFQRIKTVWGLLALSSLGGVHLLVLGMKKLWIVGGLYASQPWRALPTDHDLHALRSMDHIAGANLSGLGVILLFLSFSRYFFQDRNFHRAYFLLSFYLITVCFFIFTMTEQFPFSPWPFLLGLFTLRRTKTPVIAEMIRGLEGKSQHWAAMKAPGIEKQK